VGGGPQSPIWAQTLSDVTGRAQLVPKRAIGASYGDALLTAIGTGLVPPDTDWAKITREIEPEPANRALHDDLYGTWLELLSGYQGPDASAANRPDRGIG
jgi:xylulokinase